ncbi:hypothetical protein GGQ92_002299 [Gracilibacillus halotolerans]|uniref:Uncharacterized protein n=1 Tax=Gracilibacillus halotolerans TaxID=74386 RepID=A0A841RNN5_9BACI|nr:hypothetical protein [Gracilibacillus halotolerans]MBB6513487.1 hypothetical protein [Gracilibacillus halotolerans]
MKRLIVILGIAILFIITFAVWFTFPKQHNKVLEGIHYQLGNDEEIYEVTVGIDGEIRRNLIGTKTFEGILDIEDEELPVPKDERNVTIKFDEYNRGVIVYTGFRNGVPYTHSYGSIFVNHDFTKITIQKGSWDGEEGYMITAPAKDYFDAKTISNELMEKFIQEPL